MSNSEDLEKQRKWDEYVKKTNEENAKNQVEINRQNAFYNQALQNFAEDFEIRMKKIESHSGSPAADIAKRNREKNSAQSLAQGGNRDDFFI